MGERRPEIEEETGERRWERGDVRGSYPKKIPVRYILIEAKALTSSSIETPLPCLYNCLVGSWQLYRQTANAVYSRQSSYTDREKSSHLMTTGGAYASIKIYLLWSYPKNVVLFI